MIQKTFIFFTLLLACMSVNAQQSYREHIQQDTRNAGAIFSPYDMSRRFDTPAPKGYKPFYISHFGRHGSRYMSDDIKDLRLQELLHKADNMGLLTPDGKKMMARADAVVKDAEGRYGQLTSLGEKEHKMLASRMFHRFSSVFKVKDGRVRAESSLAPRCLVSMAAFTGSLKGEAPELEFTFAAGERHQRYIAPEGTVAIAQKMARGAADSLSRTLIKGDKLFNRIFANAEKAGSLTTPTDFASLAYSMGCEAICIGDKDLDIFEFFDIDELEGLAIVRNNLSFAWSGHTIETGDIRARSAAPLLKRMVEKADEALSDGHIVADLCFGHDSNVLPLSSLMGIEGDAISFVDAHQSWFADEHLSMAANIQIIFYKDRKGNVLVKVLENERETLLHIGVEPVCGFYYDWESLRSAFLLKCA